jgi:hypothetical protein
MIVNSDTNFDFERFTEEVFIVEAFDNPTDASNRRSNSIEVIFRVLDQNDRTPDLKVVL